MRESLSILLEAANEKIGFDKYIKANTAQRRTHSLFSQGRTILTLVRTMSSIWRDQVKSAFYVLWEQTKNITSDQFAI